jgi:hypothetical protein
LVDWWNLFPGAPIFVYWITRYRIK